LGKLGLPWNSNFGVGEDEVVLLYASRWWCSSDGEVGVLDGDEEDEVVLLDGCSVAVLDGCSADGEVVVVDGLWLPSNSGFGH
jgi:hypothetical protein